MVVDDDILIPRDKIDYGISSTMSHSYKLYEPIKFLCEQKDYHSAFILGMFTLEEFGKHFMLSNKKINNENILKNEWNGQFKNHKYKVTAMIDHYRLSSNIGKYDKKILDSLRKQFVKNLDLKSKLMYASWDNDKNEWYDVDSDDVDLIINEQAQIIKQALDYFLYGYLKDTKSNPEIISKTIDEIQTLLKNHKIEGYCPNCQVTISDNFILCKCDNNNKNVRWDYSK